MQWGKKESRIKRTHLSLYYLAGYLFPAGLALVFVPDVALDLLFSNSDGAYGDVFPRLTGGVLIALALLIVQIIRHRLEVMYPVTLAARLVLIAVFVTLFVRSSDPFFVALIVVVGFGVMLTGVSYYLDRRGKPAA
jgi:cytochrome c biogenesis protein CcdA